MERLPFYLFFICAGFLSGSIAYSYFLPKLLLHKNILLLSDDGNPGCANVFKYIGVPMGILCLLCDFFKGYLSYYVGLAFSGGKKPSVFFCPGRSYSRPHVQPVFAFSRRKSDQCFIWLPDCPFAGIWNRLVAGDPFCNAFYAFAVKPAQPARCGQLCNTVFLKRFC